MLTTIDSADPDADNESAPTWAPPGAEETARVPWWPAVLAPFVGGAIAFKLFTTDQEWLLRAGACAVLGAFIVSLFFRTNTSRLVRRIAGGLLLGVVMTVGVLLALLSILGALFGPLFSGLSGVQMYG